MKKRHLIAAVAAALVLMLLGLTCGALAGGETLVGSLSYLNMTEKEEDAMLRDNNKKMIMLLKMYGILKEVNPAVSLGDASIRYYDTLDGMLLALQAGEVRAIRVPYYTARYLAATADGLEVLLEYHPEKVDSVSQLMVNMLSEGYSFMLKEDRAALRDDLDRQITAMKGDGTLQKLIDEHIIKASETGETTAVSFEKYEGDPIRIAVTGSLPPMDYVAADGSFAGFNTAVLAEIGRRLQKNIELVQVDSIGRALALAEGVVDVAFWTRGLSQGALDTGIRPDSPEISDLTGEKTSAEAAEKYVNRDMPEGTIITQPYFSDIPVLVALK